jgi:hypothetical protein
MADYCLSPSHEDIYIYIYIIACHMQWHGEMCHVPELYPCVGKLIMSSIVVIYHDNNYHNKLFGKSYEVR